MNTVKIFLVMAALTLTVVANAETKSAPKFAFESNADLSSVTKVIMAKDAKDNDLKYEYKTDSQGRVVSKVKYFWNKADQNWTPMCAYSVFFGNDSNVLSYSEWNKVSHTFISNGKQAVYDAKKFPVLIAMPN